MKKAQALTAPKQYTREAWLNDLGALILDEIIMPTQERLGLALKRPKFRVSIGYAPRGAGKYLGVCAPSLASSSGHNEIFITPAMDDHARIGDVLLHELVHAVLDNEDGHTGRFARIAKGCGLTGKMTATVASPELTEQLEKMIATLPALDVARLSLNTGAKRQQSRSRPVKCVECGFGFNASREQLHRLHDESQCPVCGETHSLLIKWREGDEIPEHLNHTAGF